MLITDSPDIIKPYTTVAVMVIVVTVALKTAVYCSTINMGCWIAANTIVNSVDLLKSTFAVVNVIVTDQD